MARARNIKPGFFTNDVLAECSALARILFQGLWCHADREGRMEDRPRKLKAEILPYDECNTEELLCQLESRGFIVRYSHGSERFIQVVNFCKHQNPHVKESESTIPAPCLSDAKPEQAGLIPDSLNLIPDSLQEQVVDSQPETKKPTATATRLPTDWMPSSDDIDFCAKERSDLAPIDVADRFRDYWIAQPGAKGRKLDWSATWRNWVRNEKRQTLPSGLGRSQRDIERDEVSDVLCGRKRPSLTERVINGEVIHAS